MDACVHPGARRCAMIDLPVQTGMKRFSREIRASFASLHVQLRRCVNTGGGIRTHTGVPAQRILSPQRLPFRHAGELIQVSASAIPPRRSSYRS